MHHLLFLTHIINIKKLSFSIKNMSFYAVAKGRNPGIYSSWDECKLQVHKFPGPVFKKFNSKTEAESFINNKSNLNNVKHFGTSATVNKNKYSSPTKLEAYKPVFYTHEPKPNFLRTKKLLSSTENNEQLRKAKQKKFDHTSESSTSSDHFTVDSHGYTEVYTDGSCTSNGAGNAKAGIGVWFSDNNIFNVSQPVVGRATNNMAEIQAVTIAAEQAQKAGISKLKVITDSKFLISCATNWMSKWKRTGWKTSDGKDVINKVELLQMEKALSPLTVTWSHVRGHIGVHGNEMADMLARNGSERYRK